MNVRMEMHGLDELLRRMSQFPGKARYAIRETMKASLLVLWENVPEYPSPPPDSDYVRTGTLGRTLGSSEGGGKAGQPDIFEITEGGRYTEGKFGTRLHYAPYVIGIHQAWMHQFRWWNIVQLAEKSQGKITRLWNIMAEELAKFLDGKGL